MGTGACPGYFTQYTFPANVLEKTGEGGLSTWAYAIPLRDIHETPKSWLCPDPVMAITAIQKISVLLTLLNKSMNLFLKSVLCPNKLIF